MRRSLAILALVVIPLVAWVMSTRSSTTSPFSKAAESNRQATLPSGGTAGKAIIITRDDWRVVAEWHLETNMEWPEYKNWLKKRLASSYQLVREEPAELLFRRVRHAEIHELRILAGDARRQTRVRFSVSPW